MSWPNHQCCSCSLALAEPSSQLGYQALVWVTYLTLHLGKFHFQSSQSDISNDASTIPWNTETPSGLLPILNSESQTFDHSAMVVANEASKPMIKVESLELESTAKTCMPSQTPRSLLGMAGHDSGMTGCFCMLIEHGIVAIPSGTRASQPAAMNSTCTMYRPQQEKLHTTKAILDPNSPPAGGQTGTPALVQGHASGPGWTIGTYPKHPGETQIID